MASDISDACKHRSKRKPPAFEEIVDICYQLKIKKCYHKEIAQRHNMSVVSVAKIKSKLTKDPSYLNDLYQKRQKQEAVVGAIRKAIELNMTLGDKIYRAKDLIALMPFDMQEKAKLPLVQRVLKQKYDMSYRQILTLAPQ